MLKVVLLRNNVTPKNKFGGIRKHCQELYELFIGNSTISILPIIDIPNLYIPILRKRIFRWKALYYYLKDSGCNIVHIHGFATLDVAQAIIAAAFAKKRIVYSPHFHPFKYLRRPLLGKIYFYGCLRFLFRYISAIITITSVDANFFARYHKHVYKVPHLFDEDRAEITSKLPKKKNMILFVGRNEENKGLFHLMNLDPKYEVHLVTNGIVGRKDFIVHTNISNEALDALYEQTSLVVIPSRYEAFSYVALEAFAHGTPVVMSDTVMIADYLRGIKGFSTFTFGDEQAFLKAVDETIGTNVETEKILSIFSKEKIKNQYTHIYLKAGSL